VICCRQNLKTGLFKQAAIGWLYVTDERTVVWSAHEMSTTLDALRDLELLLTESRPVEAAAQHQEPRDLHRQRRERIELATGQQSSSRPAPSVAAEGSPATRSSSTRRSR
jgi:hypothetical protein